MSDRPTKTLASYTLDGITPTQVVTPTSIEELQQAIAESSSQNSASVPWGGGTRMTLGNTPTAYDTAVDLTGLNQLVEHNPGDLTITVEAGHTLANLNSALTEHGQFLAIDPPLPEQATVGGMLAVGTSGPLKWQYGNPRDLVIGMSVVQSDGILTKSGGQVVKNVSGYDMSRLHIGGLGSLGIIAEVSFKLSPLPVQEATLLARFKDRAGAMEGALGVFHGHVAPLALTVFDGVAARKIGIGSREDSWYMAVRLGGRQMSLSRQLQECDSTANEQLAVSVEQVDGSGAISLWRKMADFGWDVATKPKVGVRISLTPMAAKNLILGFESDDAIESAIVCHPAHGNLLVNWYASNETDHLPGLTKAVQKTRVSSELLGGTTVIEQGPIILRKEVGVWGTSQDIHRLMQNMKTQYDPTGTLNPGRFVGGI